MARGDLISVPCLWGLLPYRHFGIDLGDGSVVHLAKVQESRMMQVQHVSWAKFADGQPVRVEVVERGLGSDEVVQRATQSVGLVGYHLALGNCEHFARACKTGKPVSHQADRVIGGLLRATLAGALACSTKVAAQATAMGLSRGIVSRATGVSSLLGELARQSAYAASRHCAIEHPHADRIGKTAGTITAGVVGSIAGGPVGGLSSAALYLSIDHMTHRVWRHCVAGAKSSEAQGPYRRSSDSAGAVPEC